MNDKIIEINRVSPDRDMIRQWERDEVSRAIRENKVLKESSRKRAALNLARMLNDAAIERGLKTKIASLAWQSDDAPLKKLDLVTLPLNGEITSTRLRRLAKKPRHYEKLARAIAQVVQRNVGDVCVEAFRGTEIEAGVIRRAQAFTTNRPEDWDSLVELIEAMTNSVAIKTSLRRHLLTISSQTGTYHLGNGLIQPCNSYLLPHGSLANGYEAFEEFPPIPSVPLVSTALVEPFERTLIVKSEEGLDRAIPVTVRIWREIRLAIGPADDLETPRPMFEIRTAVDLLDDNGRDWAGARKWFYISGQEDFATADEDGAPVAASIDLGPELGISARWVPLLEDGELGTPMPIHLPYSSQVALALADDRPGPRQYEHIYATWVPITSFTCDKFLGGEVSGHCVPSQELGHGQRTATLLPNSRIGSWVEAALTSDQGLNLERRLEDEARRMVALVEGHIASTREEAGSRHRSAVSQWKKASQGESRND